MTTLNHDRTVTKPSPASRGPIEIPSAAKGGSAAGTPAAKLLFVILLLAGVGVRIFGAWLYRHSHNPDFGVVALMARHIAEGSGFPVFFYGQAYMGSLEPAVSALFCRILGCSGFAVCLGTALFGVGLLPLVYAWGRDAGGKSAGLAAMAFCAIGPVGYFHYLASPRGGYAATLLLGSLIIWWACRIGLSERGGQPVRPAGMFLFGLIAGLAFWTNWLTAPAMLTAALMILCLTRGKTFGLRFWAAVPGFAIGSLPLWIWNVRHEWQSFASHHTPFEALHRFPEAHRLFWTRRLPPALDLQGVGGIAAAAAVLLLIVSSVSISRAAADNSRRHSRAYSLAAFLFLGVFVVVFSLSPFAEFDTPRYLLPLVPALAVILGVGTARLLTRVPAAVALLPLALLVGWQVRFVPDHCRRAKKASVFFQSAQELGTFMDRSEIGNAYTPYILHGLNFALGERIAFADGLRERCLPLAQAVELAGQPGIVNRYLGIDAFLQATGASAATAKFGPLALHYDITGPPRAVDTLGPDSWSEATDGQGRDVLAALTDARMDTALTGPAGDRATESVHIRLHEPAVLAGARMLCPDLRYPSEWEVEGRSAPEAPWVALTARLVATGYFWSGPRLYVGGDHYRLECRFSPASVTELRITFRSNPARGACMLSELHLLAPSEANPLAPSNIVLLMNALHERGIHRLYADRWTANAVHERSGGRIPTNLEPRVFPHASDMAGDLELDEETALAVWQGDAAPVRIALSQRGIDMHESEVGGWMVFYPDPDNTSGQDVHGLRFRGPVCVLADSKRWACALMDQAEQAVRDSEDIATSIALLRRAAEASPGYTPVMEQLADRLRLTGEDEEAAHWRAVAAARTTPEVPAEIRFDRGLVFHGLSLTPFLATPGETVAVKYFWTAPPGAAESLAVFVHFRNGDRTVFQDDHELLADINTDIQPCPEIFLEARNIPLPPDAPLGDYTIHLGIFEPALGRRRLSMRTDLPHRRRAAVLPLTLRVTDAKGE